MAKQKVVKKDHEGFQKVTTSPGPSQTHPKEVTVNNSFAVLELMQEKEMNEANVDQVQNEDDHGWEVEPPTMDG